METKLALVALFAAVCAGIYALAMRSTPRKGWLLVCEKLFVGVITLYLLNLALSPFSLKITENPLSSLAAGYWGIPGAVLVFVTQQLL